MARYAKVAGRSPARVKNLVSIFFIYMTVEKYHEHSKGILEHKQQTTSMKNRNKFETTDQIISNWNKLLLLKDTTCKRSKVPQLSVKSD